ncbi:MAG: TonB-dependent receptor, partial [Acidobacteria bacterium]
MRRAGLLILVLAVLQDAAAAAEHHGLVKFGGLPVPGVAVTATQGRQRFAAITDPQGIYAFPELPEGVWTIQVEMPGFAPIQQDITIAAGAAGVEWELKMLPFEEIHAEVLTNAAPAPAAAAAPSRRGFQRAEVNASSNSTPSPGTETAASGAFANLSPEDLNQRAADGLLINGSVNNGAVSPFAQLAAFGNNRRGTRPLYTGGVGVIVDNSGLNARPYSLTGQDTPKLSYSRLLGSVTLGGP